MFKLFKIVFSFIAIILSIGCSEREINTKTFLSIEQKTLELDDKFKFIFHLYSEKPVTLKIHENPSEVFLISSRNNICNQSSFILAKRKSTVIDKEVLLNKSLKVEINSILKFDEKNSRFELIMEDIGKMCFKEEKTKVEISFKLFESLDRMIEIDNDDGIYLGHISLELPSKK